jgi:hypothetical protein
LTRGDEKLVDGPWDVWGALLNGVIGSIVGAGIAVVVLVISLKKQSAALATQLEAQQTALAHQLTAAQHENAKNRINAATADLLGWVAKIPRATMTDYETQVQNRDQCFTAFYRLQLDMTEAETQNFGEPLRQWLIHLTSGTPDEFWEVGETPTAGGPLALNRQAGWLCIRIPNWVRSAGKTRIAWASEISRSLEIAKKGTETWTAMYPG